MVQGCGHICICEVLVDGGEITLKGCLLQTAKILHVSHCGREAYKRRQTAWLNGQISIGGKLVSCLEVIGYHALNLQRLETSIVCYEQFKIVKELAQVYTCISCFYRITERRNSG